MSAILFAISVFCLSVGLGVLWLNPRRFTNQVFVFVALLVAIWYWSVVGAIADGVANSFTPVRWIKTAGVVTAFLIWSMWLLQESILHESDRRLAILRRSVPTLLACTALAVLCVSDAYITSNLPSRYQKRGLYYIICTAVAFIGHSILLFRASREMQRQYGMKRVELQFLSLNLGSALAALIAFNYIGNVFTLIWLKHSTFFILLAAYILAAWAITFHRVFNGRQIFLSLGQRTLLVTAMAAAFMACSRVLTGFIPIPMDYFLGVALCTSTGLWLDRRSREWLRLGGEDLLAEMRTGIIAIARTEPDPDQIISKFERLLAQHCHCKSAVLMFNVENRVTGGGLSLKSDSPGFLALCEAGWATPESLNRRRAGRDPSDLEEFLSVHGLGLIVAAPHGSSSPTLIVALGANVSRWPYTYPEVQRVQNVAELMDNILTRSRLTAHAAREAKVEDLVVISRGLAHDLKNLITPVASYLLHMEGKSPCGSVEEEVHTAAQRSARIITDYIDDVGFFAQQLSPRFQTIRISSVFDQVSKVITPRVNRRNITLEIRCEEQSFTADAVMLQRLLVNLVNNAIDAVPDGGVVVLRGLPLGSGKIRLQVADKGEGISPEILPRIFEPYFTTKQFGDVRGFGLGLAICHKIARLHRGTIAVESAPGLGATFTLDLPGTLQCG